MLRQHKKYGQAFLEFMVLIALISVAYLICQKYIVRAFSGRWKSVGDSLGQGRLYDSRRTLECAYGFQYTQPPVWYMVDCFDQRCEGACLSSAGNADTCGNCVLSCEGNCVYDDP